MKILSNYPVQNVLFPNLNQWLEAVSDNLLHSDSQFTGKNHAAMNVKETAEGYEVELAAPGFKKESFTLKVENNVLFIAAKTETNNETLKESGKYTRREFSYQSIEKSLRLGNNIDAEKIEATYTDGILYVKLPRKVEVKPAAQVINIQ